jgi:4-amino-4-deoxy-L-arabinose transferase-like glycosyltransferase
MEGSLRSWKDRDTWVTGGFILASGLVLFFNLWGRSLENHGYLRYAEIAREMIRSGEWAVPHLNGDIYIDKPPLLFWLIALPSSIYGSVTPLIARLPTFFSAWLGVSIVVLWGKRVYRETWAGVASGVILVSSYQYFFQARLAKTDILLCSLIVLCFYFFYLGYKETGRRGYLLQAFSFLSMGLATLTKGPLGCVIPLVVIVGFLIKERRVRMLLSKEFFLGYLIFGLTVFPWVFLFIHRLGWEETKVVVGANPILARRGPFYFYLQHLWTEFFPGSVFLPFSLAALWKQRKSGISSGLSFFLIWFFGFLFLLMFFKFKATRYLLPALPSMALIIGGAMKKSLKLVLIPCLLCVLAWHATEFYRIRNDRAHSPGRVLAGELRPQLQTSALLGYQLDDSTLEELNFYLDRIIPVLKKAEEVEARLQEGGKRSVLMPQGAYEALRQQGLSPDVATERFPYKEETLILVHH